MRGKNHPKYKQKIKLTCKQCGKDFSIYPSWVKKGIKFCSAKCYGDWESEHQRGENNSNFKGGNIELICQKCGKKFQVLRWHTFRKFCSHICRAKAYTEESLIRFAACTKNRKPQRKIYTCTNCGETFDKKREKGRANYFCSRKCMGEYIQGKNNPFYNGKFSDEALRKIIKARHTKPNVPETKLIKIIEKNEFFFQYVGNGEVIIDGKNPDFIHIKEKKVIELFGVYWHSPMYGRVRPNSTYNAVKSHYMEHGYQCLIIWDTELINESQVTQKISEFVGGK